MNRIFFILVLLCFMIGLCSASHSSKAEYTVNITVMTDKSVLVVIDEFDHKTKYSFPALTKEASSIEGFIERFNKFH